MGCWGATGAEEVHIEEEDGGDQGHPQVGECALLGERPWAPATPATARGRPASTRARLPRPPFASGQRSLRCPPPLQPQLKEFTINSKRLLAKCTKPDRKGER